MLKTKRILRALAITTAIVGIPVGFVLLVTWLSFINMALATVVFVAPFLAILFLGVYFTLGDA